MESPAQGFDGIARSGVRWNRPLRGSMESPAQGFGGIARSGVRWNRPLAHTGDRGAGDNYFGSPADCSFSCVVRATDTLSQTEDLLKSYRNPCCRKNYRALARIRHARIRNARIRHLEFDILELDILEFCWFLLHMPGADLCCVNQHCTRSCTESQAELVRRL
jgi:hypothetical protein